MPALVHDDDDDGNEATVDATADTPSPVPTVTPTVTGAVPNAVTHGARQDLIRVAHAGLGAFHASKEATIRRLRSAGYEWPHQRRDVATFVDGCLPAQ